MNEAAIRAASRRGRTTHTLARVRVLERPGEMERGGGWEGGGGGSMKMLVCSCAHVQCGHKRSCNARESIFTCTEQIQMCEMGNLQQIKARTINSVCATKAGDVCAHTVKLQSPTHHAKVDLRAIMKQVNGRCRGFRGHRTSEHACTPIVGHDANAFDSTHTRDSSGWHGALSSFGSSLTILPASGEAHKP